jgi:hypothetical protein
VWPPHHEAVSSLPLTRMQPEIALQKRDFRFRPNTRFHARDVALQVIGRLANPAEGRPQTLSAWRGCSGRGRFWHEPAVEPVSWLPLSVRDHPARGLALSLLQPEPARRRADPGRARHRGQLRDHPRVGPALRPDFRRGPEAPPTTAPIPWQRAPRLPGKDRGRFRPRLRESRRPW